MKLYYALAQQDRQADIMIYGDITSWPWLESDVSAYLLGNKIAALDVDRINVYINSYGGEVAEGLAIYNALRRHKAKIKTVVDGFACSAASVIFEAGDEREMNPSSLLLIHNAWTYTAGDAATMRKAADDLEKITAASITAYMDRVNIDEAALKSMMDVETWILPEEALKMGFATAIIEYVDEAAVATQSARKAFANLVMSAKRPAPATQEPKTPEPPAEPPQARDYTKFFVAAISAGKGTK